MAALDSRSTSPFSLAGRVAVVTGGGGGLGTSICTALADAGAQVAIVARALDRCEAVAAAIRAKGGIARAYSADVTDPVEVDAMAGAVARDLGPVTILVNNAGVTSPKSIFELSVEDWDRIMAVSAKGAFLCTRAIGKAMADGGRGGAIINMGSLLSERALRNRSAYSAAKAAVANFTRASAIELGPNGITVNALAPTVIITDLNREMTRKQPDLYKGIVDRTPLGRLGETSDLSGAVVFLASPAASFITGQILHIDGGYSAS